jgi:hypothetical protein
LQSSRVKATRKEMVCFRVCSIEISNSFYIAIGGNQAAAGLQISAQLFRIRLQKAAIIAQEDRLLLVARKAWHLQRSSHQAKRWAGLTALSLLACRFSAIAMAGRSPLITDNSQSFKPLASY